jgi:hypothetical protein
MQTLLDPRLEAFLSPKAPDPFRSVLGSDDVCKPDPLDVLEIHNEARDAFDLLLNRNAGPSGSARSAPADRILLVRGDSGSGKTHLMRAFRNTAHRCGALFAYMQLTTGIGDYTRYILLKVLDALQRPHDVELSDESSLSLLSRGILQDGIVADLAGIDAEGQLVSAEEVTLGLERLGRFAAVPSDVLQTLLCLQLRDPVVSKRVFKYLRCEELIARDRSLLGDVPSHVGAFHETIDALAAIVRELYDMPLVICVDQLEDSYEPGPDAPARFRSAVAALRALTENANTVVVISSLSDFYEEARRTLDQSLIDRLETGLGPVTLRSSAGAQEIRAILGYRLRYLLESMDARYDESEPLYPFDPEVAALLANQRLRTIVRVAGEARERSVLSGMPPRIEQPFLKTTVDGGPSPTALLAAKLDEPIPTAITDLGQAWNDFQVTFRGESAENAKAIGDLIVRALGAVRSEVAPSREVSIDRVDDGWTMRLTIGGETEGSFLDVANQTAAFGHLGKAVEAIGFRALRRGLAPIVVRNDDFPKGPKTKFAQILGTLIAQGGRTVVIRENELRAILAYFAFADQHDRKPEFAAWRKDVLPLASLPGIKALLRIDGEPEPLPQRNGTSHAAAESCAPPAGSAAIVAEHAPREIRIVAPSLTEPIELGTLSDGRALTVVAHDLTRHAAILGGAGSGKTTLAFNLIEQLLARGVAAVLVDRKGDLAAFADPNSWLREVDEPTARRRQWLHERLDVRLYTPGSKDGRDLSIPTLPTGLDKLSTAEAEQEVHNAAEGLAAMLEWGPGKHNRLAILKQAITTLGTVRPSERTDLATLVDFISEAPPELLAAIGKLDRKLLDKVVQDIETLRINQGRLLDGTAEPLDVEGMLDASRAPSGRVPLTILSTKFLGAVPTQHFWIARLLSEIGRYASRNPKPTLQAVVFMDEADHYLPATSKPATKEPLENLIRRARSAGIGIFLATQSPGDLDYKSRENITTWLAGRVSQERGIEKLKPIFGNNARAADELPALTVGTFYAVDERGARRFRAALPCIVPLQLDETRILEVARTIGR